jgi:hypothetical protein
VGGLAVRRRCTADRGAGCTGARPALAALRASAMGNYRHGLYTKETRMRLRAMRDLALLVATACSNPPAGRARWTLELLAGELVRLAKHP